MDHCVPDINDQLPSPRSSPIGARKYRPLPLKLADRKLLREIGSRSSMSPSPTPSPTPPRVRLGTRTSPSGSEAEDDDDIPQFSKRRRMNCDTPSPCGTPNNLTLEDSTLDLTLEGDLLTSSMLLRPDFGDLNDSNASSPTMSPSTSIIFQNSSADQKKGIGNFRGRYKKDELWPAIEGNYQFLMGGEIIETCKSTESDLSWESDDVTTNITTVSFIEFFQQYKELTDWLNHIQIVTQRQSSSLSEKYLNQTYHEEMLQSSPRRKLFNDYAKQLMRRYPSRKDEVLLRLQHLNKLWGELEAAISPLNGHQDQQTMLNDLEQDLIGLRQWLHEVEGRLLPLCVLPDWTAGKLREKLDEHQVLQREIQAHSKIVSAVLKLCERLYSATGADGHADADKKLLADSLERRWHAILLQSLEWQCRLEEAICNGIKQRPSLVECTTPDSDDSYTGYVSNTSDNNENSLSANGNHGNTTYSVQNDDGLESDTSNFDVIPFSESEYEKITGDTDGQTDDNVEPAKSASVAIPSRKRRSPERCEGMEHCGTDSALGRSVSDPSLSAEQRAAIYHSSIKLTHDKINQAVNEAVATRNVVTMRSAQEEMVVPNGIARQRATRPVSLKVETHDVGYSSESHSNEEQDYNRYKEINGNVQQNGHQSPTGRNGQQSPTQNILDQEGNQVQIAKLRTNVKKPVDNTWRYSMTSAYDTSSNCSDHNCSPDDLEANSPSNSGHSDPNHLSGVRGHPKQHVSSLLSTPNQTFYQMTTIETDSEATSTADRHAPIDDARGGAATDAESELSKSLELPFDDTPIRFEGPMPSKTQDSSAKARLDAVFENVEPLDTPMGSLESPAQVVPSLPRDRQMFSDEDQSMDESGACEEMCESNALFEMEDYVDSKHEAPSQPLDCNGIGSPTMGSTPVKPKNRPENPFARKQDSVSKLLHQANLLALDEDIWPLKNTPWFDTPIRCKSQKFARTQGKLEGLNQSYNSTEGSVMATDASIPSGPSACEASCEGTSSESEGEYPSMSSGSDGEGNGLINSTFVNSKSAETTLCGSPAHSRLYSRGSSSASVGQSLYRRRNRHLKHLSPSSDDLESPQYSVSESAINELRSNNKHMLHRLRRATSDLPALVSSQRQSTPRKIRRRRVRRAGWEESSKLSLSPIKVLQSQSLPSSRRHSSRSHSRSLSPASLQKTTSDVDALEPIQQEDNVTPVIDVAPREDVTLAISIPVQADALHARLGCGAVTAETDAESIPRHDQSLTSAAEFSESAWDNLHLIYPSISSDPGEEKLEPSALQKDWEFPPPPVVIGDELTAPPVAREKTNRTPPLPEKSKVRSKEKRISNSKMAASAEDSDSDWDEIHSVINDARKAFNFTETTLKKFRKDNMETGIFIDPSEYDAPLETCDEHIVCLEELRSVLEAKTNPDADEIHEITELIGQWRELAALAVERRTQSASLCAIYKDLVTLQKSLPEACAALEEQDFDSVHDLEHNIKVLQENKMLLRQEYRDKVSALVGDLADFQERYPGLKMGRFDEEVTLLQNRLELAMERSVSRASDLQTILTSWYDFSETRRELEYLLGQEKRHLQCLDGTEDVVLQMFSPQDLQDTLHDLKALDRELEFYERKLQSMRRAQSEVSRVHSESAHKDMCTTLDDIERTFGTLRNNCQTMTAKIQIKLSSVDKGTQVSLGVDAKLSTVAEKDKFNMTTGRNSLCWRLLKVALPIQLALIFGFSLLCLYDSEYCDAGFGLIFSPHLRYVNGPPPT